MRLSIDASGLGAPLTGTAVYLQEILKAWQRDADFHDSVTIFATSQGRQHLANCCRGSQFDFQPAPDCKPARILWQQIMLPGLLKRQGIDVHWGAGFVLPLLSRTPGVVTIYDLTFQMFPEVHEPMKRIYFPFMIRASVKKARQVLTISESAKADLERFCPEGRGKTTVTLLAPRPFEANPDTAAPSNAPLKLFFVGTLEPRKNLRRLLEAWQKIPEDQRRGAELVSVGATGWMVQDLIADAQKLSGVRLLGAINDEQLAAELRSAAALVYPSLYEGFGLPVVEAMALGVPVLTSNTGATREVAGDAALLVDPHSVDSIREGLIRLISDAGLRSSLAAKGRTRAADFSWDRAAAQTLGALRQAVVTSGK